jgi:hypothetical protein
MEAVGIPEKIRNIIMRSYENAFIQIEAKSQKTGNINIGKEVKQGSPLSSTLFNLRIDPFIRFLKEKISHRGYHYCMGLEEKVKVVQAYVDDLLIFRDDKEHLNEHVAGITIFMSFARITFNPNKCKLIVNNFTKEIIPELTLPNEFGE